MRNIKYLMSVKWKSEKKMLLNSCHDYRSRRRLVWAWSTYSSFWDYTPSNTPAALDNQDVKDKQKESCDSKAQIICGHLTIILVPVRAHDLQCRHGLAELSMLGVVGYSKQTKGYAVVSVSVLCGITEKVKIPMYARLGEKNPTNVLLGVLYLPVRCSCL